MKDQPTGFTAHGPGRRLGDFWIEEQIGRGGMGVVYRARREATGEVVALKLMAPELAGNDDYRVRFMREAQLGPSLEHPNVVPVQASGEVDGELFIAMKLVEGSDLKDVIRKEGRLAPARAIHIFRQAADALDAAHGAGMVHRDVKPQNILVSPDESARGSDLVYLTDFGLVRPVTSETASRTGQVFGSVGYMSPELIEGLPADGRADVYALACVIFEALTGVVPYERENEVATLWAHINEDPPLVTDKCPDVPGGVNDVLLKALAKHPDDRFLTCGEMVASLEIGLGRKLSQLKYAYVRPLVKRVPRRKTEHEVWSPNYFPELSRVRSTTRGINWWKVGAFATACFLIVSVQVVREGGIPEAISDVAGAAGSAGQSLIDAISREDDGSATAERRVPGSESRPAEEGSVLSFPGGLGIAGKDDGSEQAESLESPTLRLIAPPDSPLARSLFVFSSNRRYPSSQRKFEGSMDLYAMSADGSRLRNLSARDVTKSDTIPVLSPCRQLAFTHIRHKPLFTLYILAPDGTLLLEEKDWDITNDVAWSPDCRQIVYRQGQTLVIRDVYTSEERLLISWPEASPRFPRWSPDGTKIAFNAKEPYTGNANITRAEDIQIYVINADGTGLTQITSTPDFDQEATWSPDGKRIAFRRALKTGAAVPDGDVWIMNADGTDQRKLTDALGDDRPIGWSPNGRHIIFFTDRENRSSVAPYFKGDIYVMDADGANERDLVPDGGGEEAWASWQPPVYRTISAGVESRELSGRVEARQAPCAAGQDVHIQRKEVGGWETIGSVATTDSGRFSATLPSAGAYRATLPLTKGKGGLVCGISASRAHFVD